MEIYKEFVFEAAHRLPNVPEGHRCARLHGHSWKGTIYVRGRVGEKTGWIMDYADIRRIFAAAWVENAPAGWWYQNGANWSQK